jgi:hypothetical protein
MAPEPQPLRLKDRNLHEDILLQFAGGEALPIALVYTRENLEAFHPGNTLYQVAVLYNGS